MIFLALLLACQPPHTPGPLVGAHRGLSPGEPENTLHAFRHSNDRTTDGTGRVADLTLRQINALDAGIKTGAQFKGERVPTFSDVLSLAQSSSVILVLDIKRGKTLDIDGVVRQARAFGMQDRIILAVRTLEDLRRVDAIDPRLASLALVEEPEDIEAFAAAGADIIRLWSDWLVDREGRERASAADLVASVRNRGKGLWILVGRYVPPSPDGRRSLHDKLKCAPYDAILTDDPASLLNR